MTEKAKPDNTHFLDGKRVGDVSRINDAKARYKEQDNRVEEATKRDANLTLYRELQAEAAKTALRQYRRFNMTGKGNERLMIEASREARQLTDRLIELIAAEGAATQAEQFFAGLQDRVEALAPLLADSANPLAASPA